MRLKYEVSDQETDDVFLLTCLGHAHVPKRAWRRIEKRCQHCGPLLQRFQNTGYRPWRHTIPLLSSQKAVGKARGHKAIAEYFKSVLESLHVQETNHSFVSTI